MQYRKRSIRNLSCLRSLVLCLLACAAGCEQPNYEVPEELQNTQPNYADSYLFDITMLSEWSGNILPKNTSMKLVFDNDESICYQHENTEFEFDCTLGCSSKGSCQLSYTVDMYDSIVNESDTRKEFEDVELECKRQKCSELLFPNETDTPIDEKIIIESPESDVAICYQQVKDTRGFNSYDELVLYKDSIDNFNLLDCSWVIGGASEIKTTWNDILDFDISSNGNRPKDTNQIRVGIGDNFGLSPDVSSTFNDLPTIQMLSSMGFTVDTLGNHSFDQSLDYLNTALNHAAFPFIATNLENVPQMLTHNVYKFAIVNLEPNDDDKGKDKLPVAFISALDSDVRSTVFAGRFGTLDIGNICSVAQTIEEAYNSGARAFFILGHLSEGSDSLRQTLNAIFSFAQSDKEFDDSDHCRNYINKLKSEDDAPDCPSKLVIPFDRLKAAFETNEKFKEYKFNNYKEFNDAFFSYDTPDDVRDFAENVYNDLAHQIREEIYNGIIGITIEASDTPIITPIQLSDSSDDTSNDNLSYYEYQCFDSKTNNDNNDLDVKFMSQIKAHTVLNKEHLPLFIRQSLKLPDDNSSHPIWLMQIPSNGKQIGNLRVRLNKTDEKNNVFSSQAISYSLTPVKDKDNDKDNIDFNSNNNVLQILVSECDSVINDFGTCASIIDDAETDLDECKNLYEFNKREFHEDITEKEKELELEKLKESCAINLTKASKYIKHNDETCSIGLMENVWLCLNAATSYTQCKDQGKETFIEKIIFNLVDYLPNTTEVEDRSESTARTNFVADIILNYANKFNSDEYHAVLINSGTVRGDTELKVITEAGIDTLVPFDNNIKSVTLTPEQLANFIAQGLNGQSRENRGTEGCFPVVSGIHYSAFLENNNYVISEIWLTDKNGALTNPIYINPHILGNKEQHLLATYSLDSTESILINRIENRVYSNTNLNNDEKIIFNTKTQSSNKIKVITLDYITSGGDVYKLDSSIQISDIHNIESPTLSEVIKNYLSEILEYNKYDTCNEYIDNASETNNDDIDNTHIYCTSMINRYFIKENRYEHSSTGFWVNNNNNQVENCSDYAPNSSQSNSSSESEENQGE